MTVGLVVFACSVGAPGRAPRSRASALSRRIPQVAPATRAARTSNQYGWNKILNNHFVKNIEEMVLNYLSLQYIFTFVLISHQFLE